jgi:hypothetical protein
MRVVLVLLCALALSGCSLRLTWHDTTGKGRTNAQAQPDARVCYDQSGLASIAPDSASGDGEAAKARLFNCMAARGWEPEKN